nr:immunoglobulin heavy chain junction region [Macaca mulatta]
CARGMNTVMIDVW